MKRHSREPQKRTAPGPSLLHNERGMILAITMMILLVISTIAAASLVNSFLERSLARNQVNATIAQNAVDAGVAEALAWLNNPNRTYGSPDNPSEIAIGDRNGDTSNDPEAGWTHTITGTLANIGTSTASGEVTYNVGSPRTATYSATIRFRKENDLDAPTRCDTDGCDNEIVLYNRCDVPGNDCWGYTQSAFASPNGYPIMVIHSEGRYGEGGIRVVEMEVARDKFDVKATGAVTAASNVEASGNITIDGRSHDIDGNLGGNCTTAFPGASVPPPLVDQNGDGRCNCTNGVSNGDDDCADPGETGTMDRGCYEATKQGTAGLAGTPSEWSMNNVTPPLTPDAALGLSEGDLRDKLGGTLPAAGTSLTKGNITYYNQDFDLSTGGLGVLIVHNPLFDSQKYSWSDPVGEHYKANFLDAAGAVVVDVAGRLAFPNYDPCLDTTAGSLCTPALLAAAGVADKTAYRSDRAPRNLEQHGANTFKGVIIADKVDKINGTADIIGALISLSTVSIDKLGNGAANIFYSCDAISLYTDVGYSIKLSWHRIR